MKLYTVKQVAEILNANPETVRRWIRDGKLNAVQSSRKDGNVISEDAFKKFLADTPKYAGIAAALSVMLPLVGMGIYPVIAGLIGAKMAFGNHRPDSDVSEEELKKYLAEIIADCENKIKRVERKIEKLQSEIYEEEKRIQEINTLRDSIDSRIKYPHSVSLPESEDEMDDDKNHFYE